ncbi:hypothetical protein GCM10010492_74250 [Saccharothrix mutabilis subsp. mutabilis]|uniref:Uncharacterized protein n=1 Tax=Saccharothrix mutabilis subsp. mutabilis TaxID=66855 RepID=A0ABN0UV59_9PSEU
MRTAVSFAVRARSLVGRDLRYCPRRPDRSIVVGVKRWFWWVTAGEAVGFAVPAVVGALSTAPVALVLAGCVEGAVLGAAQAHVLRRVVRGFDARAWVVATVLGAGFTWSVAMTAVALGERAARWPLPLLVAVAVVAGLPALVAIGFTQWLVLRRSVPRSAGWIWANGLAWAAALTVFAAFTTPLWRPGQATATVVLVGAAGGVLMAATMAAVTGLALRRLVK